jgi:hypothetical protein
MPVSISTKLDDLEDTIRTAATRHVSHGINIEQEHRLASEYDAVSRRDRRKVMVPSDADRELYCELIEDGQTVLREDTGGVAQEVGHSVSVWLILGYEDGTSQALFRQMTEGHDPDGMTRELRQLDGYQTTSEGKILYQQPDFDYDIIPIGQNGGGFDSAHVLRGTIRIDDFDR